MSSTARAKRVDFADGQQYGYRINCPGCGFAHILTCGAPHPQHPRPLWSFNGNEELPTFTPSLLCYGNEKSGQPRCHSFITDGKIQYLGDCTHKLVNQTVDLPPASPMWWDGKPLADSEEDDE